MIVRVAWAFPTEEEVTRLSRSARSIIFCFLCLTAVSCSNSNSNPNPPPETPGKGQQQAGDEGQAPNPTRACELVPSGYGPTGAASIRVEKVVSGLTVPWSIAFISAKEFLLTERPGRVRLVRDGTLVSYPVLTVDVTADGESGLLGLVISRLRPSDRR